MSLKDELESKVKEIFKQQWSERDGQKVPEPQDLKLYNDAVNLDGVVLYADLSESTKLVDSRNAFFSAEIYKSFLHCAAKIIRSEGGEITAYDGDRIMAVFLGDFKNTSAAKAALKINYARIHIINPAIKAQYPNVTYEVKHTVAIDSSSLFVARTGIRGSNDLVWVGRAANHAAKMGSLSHDFPSRISSDVYDRLHDSAKFSDGRPIWEKVTWNDMNRTIYRSTWFWPVS